MVEREKHSMKMVNGLTFNMKTKAEIRAKKQKIKDKLAIRNLKKKIIREDKSLPKKADFLWAKVIRQA